MDVCVNGLAQCTTSPNAEWPRQHCVRAKRVSDRSRTTLAMCFGCRSETTVNCFISVLPTRLSGDGVCRVFTTILIHSLKPSIRTTGNALRARLDANVNAGLHWNIES